MQPPPAGKEPRDFLPPTVAEAAAVYKYAQQYGALTQDCLLSHQIFSTGVKFGRGDRAGLGNVGTGWGGAFVSIEASEQGQVMKPPAVGSCHPVSYQSL